MMSKKILVLSQKRDGHINYVTDYLDASGVPWVRLNVEDFATNVDLQIDPACDNGIIRIRDSGLTVDINDISAVWYRKPETVNLDHFDLDPAALDYIEAEMNEILWGIYAKLDDAFWINNPFKTRIAHRKLKQLQVAAEVGFRVPETLVTNAVDPALNFAKAHDYKIAIKSLGAISVMSRSEGDFTQYGIFTRRVEEDELKRNIESIKHMPTLYQRFIEKRSELRITCVGSDVFACEIHNRDNDETNDDYRFDTPNLRHEAVERPDLEARMSAYMNKLGLNFAAFDFVVPTDGGEPVFLEANANGQWLWVQKETGQNIGHSIARLLMAG
jgi:glutathione synthase/RimK-type ligase-like ATP-grasp enzyme